MAQAARPPLFSKGATGNRTALLATDAFHAETDLAENLARTLPMNQYAHSFAATFSGEQKPNFYNTSKASQARASRPQPPGTRAPSKQAAQHGQQAAAQADAPSGLRGPKRAARAGREAWVPYAQQKLRAANNDLEGKLQKSSHIAQMLSEVRGIEDDLYARDASTGRPFSAPRRTVNVPPMAFEEAAAAAKDRQYLPLTDPNEDIDDYTYAATASNHLGRLKKLQERRRVKHLTRLDEYRSLRLKIDTDLEQKVQQVCAGLRTHTTASEQLIQGMFAGLADQHLGPLSEDHLESIRARLGAEFQSQLQAVVTLEQGLMQIEDKRSELVTAAIRETTSQLIEVAHQLPHDIKRVFQTDVKETNVHMVRNRGSYEELLARVGVSVVQRQERCKQTYRERKARWRTLRHMHTIEEFKRLVQSDAFLKPPRRRALFDALIEQMTAFEKAGMRKVKELLQMIPPYIQVKPVTVIAEDIQKLYLTANQGCDATVLQLAALEQEMQGADVALLQRLVADLVGIGAMGVEEVQAQVRAECMPLCQQRNRAVTELIEATSTAMYGQQQQFMRQLERFSHFYKKAASSWEAYIADVTKCNNTVVEGLAVRGDKYDDDMEALEGKLQTALFALRRMPDQGSLDTQLEAVRDLVGPAGDVEECHRGYSRDSVEMARAFPPALTALVKGHMAVMADQFGMQTKEAFELMVDEQEQNSPSADGEQPATGRKGGSKKQEQASSEQLAERKAAALAERRAAALAGRARITVSGAIFVVQHELEGLLEVMLHGTEAEKEAEQRAQEEEEKGEEPAEEEAEEVVEDPKGKKAEKAAKPAKLSKKEQEEERLREEAEAEQRREAEEQKAREAEELERKRNAIPVDTDGAVCMRRLQLDSALVLEQLPSIRHAFTKQSQDFGETNRSQSTEFCQARVREYTAELHLTLRKHRPRMARVEIDLYDPRKQQLEANQARFERAELRLVQLVQAQDTAFQAQAAATRAELAAFLEAIATLRARVDDPSQRSLAKLHTLSKLAKAAKLAGVDAQHAHVFGLHALLEELQGATAAAKEAFLLGCLVIGEADRGTYAVQEVEHYRQLLDRLQANIEGVLDAQRSSLEALGQEAGTSMDLTAFETNFKAVVEDLSVMEGLGHKYGAPKRNMTMTIRGEFAANETAHKEIEDLLAHALQAVRGASKVVASQGLEGPPENTPLPAAEESTLTFDMLRTLDTLRTKMLARAQYLDLLREDLQEGGVAMGTVRLLPTLRQDLVVVDLEEEEEAGEAGEDKVGKKAGKDAGGKKGGKDAGKKGGKVAKEEEASEAPAAGTFMAVVVDADAKCRLEMGELYKAYDEAHPDRKRAGGDDDEPRPASAKGKKGAKKEAKAVKDEPVDVPAAIDEHCKNETHRAEQRLRQYNISFRQQVEQVAGVLAEVARLCLADVVFRCQRRALLSTKALDKAFLDAMDELNSRLRRHLGTLKAGMENQAKAELLQLQAAEAARAGQVRALLQKHKQQLLAVQYEAGVEYVHRMAHASKTLLRLNDSALFPSDLQEDTEVPVGERKPLAGLVRDFQRQEKERLEGTGILPGFRFSQGAWPGIRKDQMLIAAVDMGREEKVAAVEEPAAGKDKGKVKGKGKEEVEEVVVDEGCTPSLTAFKTQPNRVVLATRDACHKGFVALFQTNVDHITSSLQTLQQSEQQKETSWTTKIAYLKAVV